MKCDYCKTQLSDGVYNATYGGEGFFACSEECKEKFDKANLKRKKNIGLFFVPIIVLLACILISALFIKDANHISSIIMLGVAFLGIWLTFFPTPKPNHVRMFGYKKALLYNKLGTAALALIAFIASIVKFMQ